MESFLRMSRGTKVDHGSWSAVPSQCRLTDNVTVSSDRVTRFLIIVTSHLLSMLFFYARFYRRVSCRVGCKESGRRVPAGVDSD
jgi:hypothetical protein